MKLPKSSGSGESAEQLFAAAERLESAGRRREAFRLLTKAARLGHSSSQLNLGNYYAAGIGTRKSFVKAAYWYRASFRRGNATAARNLAIDYLSRGMTGAAVRWFKKGVASNDGASFIQLARIQSQRRRSRKHAIALLKAVQLLGPESASESDKEQALELLAELQTRH
jgi:TPR repeat protein